MNQITPETEYSSGLASLQPRSGQSSASDNNDGPAPITPEENQSAPSGQPALTEADIRLLQRALLSGEESIARRRDVVEMYNRIVKLFETLNKGVGEMYLAKAEADRSVLSERIDGLEGAVNRMEGALRIELEPVLRQAMADVVAEQSSSNRPRRARLLSLAAVLSAGVLLGAVFHAPLAATVSTLETQVSSFVAKLR